MHVFLESSTETQLRYKRVSFSPQTMGEDAGEKQNTQSWATGVRFSPRSPFFGA